MTNTPRTHTQRTPHKRTGRPDAGPDKGNWRDQELTDNDDQHKQEDKLREAGQVDKGPSVIPPLLAAAKSGAMRPSPASLRA